MGRWPPTGDTYGGVKPRVLGVGQRTQNTHGDTEETAMASRPFPTDDNLFAHMTRTELRLRQLGYRLHYGTRRRRYMRTLCQLFGHQSNRGATFCIYCFDEIAPR